MGSNNKEPILIISPTELKFKFELKKQIPATLVLHNPATHTVAFKIKTTTPKKYCVRPSTGFVLPQSKVPIQIMMSAQKEKPQDFEACRDKFLVQSVKLSEEEAEQPISANLFSKVGGKDVHEFKLKVSYTQASSIPSPVKEVVTSTPPAAQKVVEGIKEDLTLPATPASALSAGEAALAKRTQAQAAPGTSTGLPMKKQMVLKGFSLVHLFLAALLAFFIGRMTS
ncbi:vesicle-associated protein [Chloropicon primus]|uniref:Vesicle-associated protein n=2 Tax=Chloropicon primus TaxID=1764295 RepID=A0A5B8MDY5_9CHLO|nr:vesicle-associated protein [Chloropicon primus]UPQ98035.1 vesicle-associated protein [Chloropicon primus]|mmetsp:Transcript_34720/g.75089  ORF Transcript_34720/g.75089 Transcript_34720/m.75089 type:complete len:226 (+) Transcript_34720:478-1155(+)|eukprot:QDZ18828.1 vesicle-associated protein [Chloropicon primus]